MKRGLGLLAVVGLVVGLGAVVLGQKADSTKLEAKPGNAFVPDLPLKRFTRLVVSHELSVRHWKAFESEEAFRGMVEELDEKLLDAGDIGASWTAKFIPENKRGETPLAEGEQSMLTALDAGAKEVWESPAPGTVRYMKRIPVGGSCRVCHATLSGDPAASAATKLKLPSRPTPGQIGNFEASPGVRATPGATTPEPPSKPTPGYIASFEITLKDR